MFIKAGDSKIKEGLRVEKVTGDSLGGTLLWLPRNVIGESQGFQLAGKSEKKGALETGSGEARVELLLFTAPLAASLLGTLRV